MDARGGVSEDPDTQCTKLGYTDDSRYDGITCADVCPYNSSYRKCTYEETAAACSNAGYYYKEVCAEDEADVLCRYNTDYVRCI